MAETGVYGRFLAGSLDPRAQEFRPRYSTTLFMPQPHRVFFQYPTISDVPLLPFCETGATYPPFPTAESAYVPVRSPVSSVATRSLVVSSVPCDVSETMVRRELEVFGEIRGVQMERVKEGIVIVHFYDIRHAERALREIRDQHMHHQCRLRNYFNNNNNNNNGFLLSNSSLPRPSPAPGLIAGHAVWAQFIVPAGKNQGTIVIFNLDSTVSTSCLKEIFERFGIFYSTSLWVLILICKGSEYDGFCFVFLFCGDWTRICGVCLLFCLFYLSAYYKIFINMEAPLFNSQCLFSRSSEGVERDATEETTKICGIFRHQGRRKSS